MRMNETAYDALVLDHGEGVLTLGVDTLVVALDDTGHEAFADSNHPVFGLGGCAFLVKDYKRLIEAPWNYMCQRFFPEVERPMHAADLCRPTSEQPEASPHFKPNAWT